MSLGNGLQTGCVLSHQCNDCHSPLVVCSQLACRPPLTAPSGGGQRKLQLVMGSAAVSSSHEPSHQQVTQMGRGTSQAWEGSDPCGRACPVPADRKNKGLSAITLHVSEARISKRRLSPN